MDTFSFYEQQATLQCVWQLFQAHPSKDEVEFIERMFFQTRAKVVKFRFIVNKKRKL